MPVFRELRQAGFVERHHLEFNQLGNH
jgi:hypothetical protein